MYTKQLLQGLYYLHRNGIMHRDIKWTLFFFGPWEANILVDNKGCIKLADFGASKQVAKLATINAAKSMKGTSYWMAPKVILQTGHNFSADIWSVGCTVIEMATGKPPWSQQYQEHPFVTKEFQDLHPVHHSDIWEPSRDVALTSKLHKKHKFDVSPEQRVHLDDSHEPVIEGSCTRSGGNDFAFSSEPVDDEVRESNIRAFLDEKALELKKLQTPLYEFYNSLNNKNKHCSGKKLEENVAKIPKLPPKIKMSPKKAASGITALPADLENKASPGNCSRQESRSEEEDDTCLIFYFQSRK